jgi:hypothetical protein
MWAERVEDCDITAWMAWWAIYLVSPVMLAGKTEAAQSSVINFEHEPIGGLYQ